MVADKNKPEDDAVTHETAVVEDAEVIEDSTTVEQDEAPEAVEPAVVEKQRGVFVPMLLGGVATAAIGFGAAQYAGNNNWPFQRADTELQTLTEQVDAQKAELTALQTEIAKLESGVADAPLQSDLAALGMRQTENDATAGVLTDRIDQAERRLTDIENRPIPEVGATVEAVQTYERELSAMRRMFEEELARIDAAQKQAALEGKATTEQANNAIERAALARIEAALDSGAPFAEAISALVASGVTVPDGLVDVAKTGAPTLVQLQAEFPASARAVLNVAVVAEPETGNIGKLSAFVKSQLGTRSLEPREGDDADAILSRAEDALRKSDIPKTIAELNALPETAFAQMTTWIELAQLRQLSVTSVSALAAELNK